MAGRITLPFWPTAHDCLSWSVDDQIAVGGGDRVAILSPRLSDSTFNKIHRDVEIFQVNAFTEREVPLVDPLTSRNFSIGEELSHRHVQALEWSSPGLAKYRKCALAILSSNHVLSIWECDGRPGISGSWKRKLIVNHLLREYYETRQPADLPEDERLEHLQVCQRVRSFTWSRPFDWTDFNNKNNQHLELTGWGHQCLAVGTEGGDIFLLAVEPPCDTALPLKTEWTVKVVLVLNVGSVMRDAIPQGLRDESWVDNPSKIISEVAESLAWGRWNRRGNTGLEIMSNLAFSANGRVFDVCLELTSDSQQPNETSLVARQVEHFVSSSTDISGPLKICQTTGLIFAFSANKIWSFSRNENDEHLCSVASHHLDNRWDEITGAAISGTHRRERRIHFTSHMSTASATTSALDLPFDDTVESTEPSWWQAINESKEEYSTEFSLGDHVQERVWGITSSPLGNFVVTCTSMHPSDSIAYMIQSEQKCIVNITHEPFHPESNLLPANKGVHLHTGVSSEAVLFALLRELDTEDENEDGKACDEQKLADAMWDIIKPPSGINKHDSARYLSLLAGVNGDKALSPEILARHFRNNTYNTPELQRAQVDNLTAIGLKKRHSTPRSTSNLHLIVTCLIKEVTAILPFTLQDGPLSIKLVINYAAVRRMLEEDSSANEASVGETWKEDCQICQKPVPFESLRWARCIDGHHFSRCGLSFLAIQGPGIAKHCGICGCQYMNEKTVSYFKTSNNEPGEEPTGSLARIIFAACDTCIYCGGKFSS